VDKINNKLIEKHPDVKAVKHLILQNSTYLMTFIK